MTETDDNWKVKALVGSALLGALAGLAAGYLFNRTAEEHGSGPPEIGTMDAIKLLIGVIGIVRGIAALGSRD